MEAKKLCFNGIQLLFCSDQCFLDFGEDVREYLIARSKTQFCMKKLFIICFLTYSVRKQKHLVSLEAINYFAPICVSGFFSQFFFFNVFVICIGSPADNTIEEIHEDVPEAMGMQGQSFAVYESF